jgi:hypothetical protein
VKNISVDLILSEIERVLQSFEEFLIDESFDVTVSHIKMPEGGRRRGKYRQAVNFDEFLKAKRCVVQIKNKDVLCCARAIVTAIASVDKDPKFVTLKNKSATARSLQTKRAKKLHRLAGVPLQKCGLAEVKKFQKFLAYRYQIYVVSKEHFNGIIFSGSKQSGKKIILYYHDDHFDVITSMPAFLERSYFCYECMRGHNNKEHSCIDQCTSCFTNCKSEKENGFSLKYCTECNRHLKGSKCFEAHKYFLKNGVSTCQKYKKCPLCQKTYLVLRKSFQNNHVCNEQFCKNCNDYVSEGHLCYIKTVAEKDRVFFDRRNEVKSATTKYIFFYFECI